ncbi:MAG: hypothetical protein K5840_01535, partial [Eubacterium sp.]|nr:hypothetical protein [Eubacterium sp.]
MKERKGSTKSLPKRFFAWALAIAMVLSLMPSLGKENVKADDVTTVSTWSELYSALQAGGSIQLSADVTYGEGDGNYAETALTVPYGITVTLDLNGYTIDRGLTASTTDGYVICIDSGATATIEDSSYYSGTITGGYNYGNGGGILNNGTLTIEGGNISGNYALGYDGGGIYNSGILTVNDGEISGNTAKVGGGIYNKGILTVNGGYIAQNYATSYAGGICATNTCYLTGGTITENEVPAGASSAGIYVSKDSYFYVSGSPVVTGNLSSGIASNLSLAKDTKIAVNGALTEGADLGVRRAFGSEGYSECVIIEPAATNVTSLMDYLDYFSSDLSAYVFKAVDGDIYITKPETVSTWSGLYEAMQAGGKAVLESDLVFGEGDGTYAEYALSVPSARSFVLDLNGHVIDRGLAGTAGGSSGYVMSNSGYLKIVDGASTASNTVYEYAGDDSTLMNGYTTVDKSSDISYTAVTVKGGLVTGGANNSGSAGAVYNSGKLKIEGGTLAGNSTKSYGAGVFNIRGTVVMSGGSVSDNQTSQYGGGIYNVEGEVSVSGGEISGNSALVGGGVYNKCENSSKTATFTLSDEGVISDNYASSSSGGGGVHNYAYYGDAVFTMSDGTIKDNSSGGNGGGIANNHYSGSATVELDSGTIEGNISDAKGGGVYNRGTLNASGTDISGNTSKYYGGGIFNYDSCTLNLSGGEIIGNTATNTSGGGIYAAGTVYVSGFPVVKGNTANGATQNLYLPEANIITVNSYMYDGASVGVT